MSVIVYIFLNLFPSFFFFFILEFYILEVFQCTFANLIEGLLYYIQMAKAVLRLSVAKVAC